MVQRGSFRIASRGRTWEASQEPGLRRARRVARLLDSLRLEIQDGATTVRARRVFETPREIFRLEIESPELAYQRTTLLDRDALLWAVLQPLWDFPWDVLGEDVSLQGNLSEHSAPVWALVAFIVVIGTMVTFSLLTGSLRHISATRASIVATLEPVVATVVAWAWLDETFGPTQLIGGAVVIAGILVAQSAR